MQVSRLFVFRAWSFHYPKKFICIHFFMYDHIIRLCLIKLNKSFFHGRFFSFLKLKRILNTIFKTFGLNLALRFFVLNMYKVFKCNWTNLQIHSDLVGVGRKAVRVNQNIIPYFISSASQRKNILFCEKINYSLRDIWRTRN